MAADLPEAWIHHAIKDWKKIYECGTWWYDELFNPNPNELQMLPKDIEKAVDPACMHCEKKEKDQVIYTDLCGPLLRVKRIGPDVSIILPKSLLDMIIRWREQNSRWKETDA